MPYPARPTEGAASKQVMAGAEAGEHDRAQGLALRLLGQREHGRAELQAKLTAKGCPAAVAAEVLEALQENGAQSDERFAAALARRRVERGYGPLYIRAELKDRQVDEGLAEDALNQPPAYWSEVATRALAKKFPNRDDSGTGTPAKGASYAAQARFLSRRGFPSELIYRLLESRDPL
ncbi:MAG: regulatory protein RecX [Gammaproteobacteria bacterium]|nr:regulatory protein RecX [Gammaproteobacteria bacterium]MYE52337.1 regulatory protein RecX [Gammaproteobacteria bacterium]MYG12653.1 regulatory protein RecX [Gammaproteobacteria bacterium]MYH15671.1 regulatory protein RecX [Gammaproteobacteria bacterium]MYK28582.1 regulatory protein RecX [Gammaproteobacteria bacterium]